MREEIEILKDHSHLGADFIYIALFDENIVQINLPFCRRLKAVETPEKRAFSGSRRTDDADDFIRLDLLGDIPKHDILSERFCKIFYFYHGYIPAFLFFAGAEVPMRFSR